MNVDHTTRFIRADGTGYPLSLAEIKTQHPNTSFPETPSEATISSFGYFVVYPTDKPVGDVVFELSPVWNSEQGRYDQVWDQRAFTPEETAQRLAAAKQERLSMIPGIRQAALQKGAPIDFGAPFGVQHIQMRDGDRPNLIGLRLDSQDEIEAGRGSEYTGVRTYENKLVPLTHVQMVQMSTLYMFAYKYLMKMSWDLEDFINAALTVEELPSVPMSLEIPVQSMSAPVAPPAPPAPPSP